MTSRKETKATCCYCGVGCGVIIESESSRIAGVRGDPDHLANFGLLGGKLDDSRAVKLFKYPSPEAISNEHRETPRGRDLDITGLGYALLEAGGPPQWPLPQYAEAGRARLYEDGIYPTPNGRARFVPTKRVPAAEGRHSLSHPPQHQASARPVARHEPHRMWLMRPRTQTHAVRAAAGSLIGYILRNL